VQRQDCAVKLLGTRRYEQVVAVQEFEQSLYRSLAREFKRYAYVRLASPEYAQGDSFSIFTTASRARHISQRQDLLRLTL
jgi:hypothetical protein